MAALMAVPRRRDSREGVQATASAGSSGSAGCRQTWTTGPSPPRGETRVRPTAWGLDSRAVVAHRYSVLRDPFAEATTAV